MKTDQDSLKLVAIRNLQSLGKVNIPFGRFTAIVGQSNVGKSAVLRALRIAARNGSSTGLVRAGAKGLQVAVAFEDGTVETVKRGPRESEFQLVPAGDAAKAQKWTKAGRDTPAEVSKVWRQADTSAGDLTFSTQHDAPFLLAVPGSTVAAVLGSLTNVAQVQEAVRQANRLRVEATTEAKSRAREAQECYTDLQAMSDLPERKAKLDAAELLVVAAEKAQDERVALARTIDLHDQLEVALEAAESAVQDVGAPLAKVEEARVAHDAWATLCDLVLQRQAVMSLVAQHAAQHDAAEAGAKAYVAQREKLLHEAGICPTCGAKT